MTNKLKNTIYLKVKGKNIERFIKRLNNLQIELLEIKYLQYNEILIKIKKEDLEQTEQVKTVYELEIIGINGIDKLKQTIKKNMYLIISLIISFGLLLYLCNTIFKVEVIHNDKSLRTIILNELKDNEIMPYKQKKTYDELQNIKEKILEKYKDKIEWLEIETHGTKYIVRLEERIITNENNQYAKRNIIAKKDALLIRIDAKKGEIIKNKNNYVKKGDVVISGAINLYEETKTQVMAEGKIYGEVWYKVTVEYPLNYKESTLTGKQKNNLVIKFLNKEIYLFNFKPYKNKKTTKIFLLKNNLLPVEFSYQTDQELNVIEEKLTKEQAVDRAIEKAKEKINSQLNEKEYIISTKKLKVEQNNSKIIVEVFISVCEDITDYQEIIDNIEIGE